LTEKAATEPAAPKVGGLMAELGTRKNADGTSAATGLKR
jgi:hypothetical protein